MTGNAVLLGIRDIKATLVKMLTLGPAECGVKLPADFAQSHSRLRLQDLPLVGLDGWSCQREGKIVAQIFALAIRLSWELESPYNKLIEPGILLLQPNNTAILAVNDTVALAEMVLADQLEEREGVVSALIGILLKQSWEQHSARLASNKSYWRAQLAWPERISYWQELCNRYYPQGSSLLACTQNFDKA